ncbi:hypothetical protein BJ912DRAFT_1046142 [Pholiota molesta]|nr:hypothetical protein BJ912DRAFT_1046142 [Pholiota molesta]
MPTWGLPGPRFSPPTNHSCSNPPLQAGSAHALCMPAYPHPAAAGEEVTQQTAPPSAGGLRPLYVVRGPSLAGRASEAWAWARSPVGSGNGRVGRDRGWEASGGAGVAGFVHATSSRQRGAHRPGGRLGCGDCGHGPRDGMKKGERGAVAASLVAESGYCGEVDVCERVDKVGGATGAPAGSPALGSPFHPTVFPKARTHIPIAGEGLDGGVVVEGRESVAVRARGRAGRGRARSCCQPLAQAFARSDIGKRSRSRAESVPELLRPSPILDGGAPGRATKRLCPRAAVFQIGLGGWRAARQRRRPDQRRMIYQRLPRGYPPLYTSSEEGDISMITLL